MQFLGLTAATIWTLTLPPLQKNNLKSETQMMKIMPRTESKLDHKEDELDKNKKDVNTFTEMNESFFYKKIIPTYHY